MGITLAIFNWSGKIPVMSDWFIIILIGVIKAGDRYFNRLVDIPSCPDDGFDFSEFNVFFNFSSSIKSKSKDVKIW